MDPGTTKQEKAARQAASNRSAKKDPLRPYYIASGVVGGSIVLALLMMVVMPAKKHEDLDVNDESLISHVNNNNVEWRARRNPSFDGYTMRDIKRWGAVGVSQGGMMNSQQCNVGQIPNMPENFDVRRRWPSCYRSREAVTHTHQPSESSNQVYFQGNCSSSYAISTASTLSNRFCISDPQMYGNLTLSPQYLLSCDSQLTRGCLGGEIDKVYYYLEGHGLVHESCRAYQAKDGRKLPCNTEMTCSDRRRYKSSNTCVMLDRDQMKGEMLLNGPIVGLMYLYDDFFVYKSGVYSPSLTATCIMDKKGQEPMLHAVKIIGWGTEYGDDEQNYGRKSSSTVAKAGVPYWLIENSFGASWGVNGVGKVKMQTITPGPEYNPMLKRDVVLLENFVLSATPYTARMEEIHAQPEFAKKGDER
ncbi:unnamed protein product [Amoebophrya sp. A120]|nr:unnamed protein product [Amoebophrya sp. A120]|eukprot:GSA120T00006248001.1